MRKVQSKTAALCTGTGAVRQSIYRVAPKLAAVKTAQASPSDRASTAPGIAVDHNYSARQTSDRTNPATLDTQRLAVDLGATYNIPKVRVNVVSRCQAFTRFNVVHNTLMCLAHSLFLTSSSNFFLFNLMKNSLLLPFTKLLVGFTGLLALLAMPAHATPPAPGPQTSQSVIRLGFLPLTDCAPLVVAKELGLFEKYGVKVELNKETSWANIRDKVLNGELEGAHCLMSLPLSVYTGVGGRAGSTMQIAMVLSNNGQGITLAQDFCGLMGYNQFKKFAPALDLVQRTKPVSFAMTFPGGTHDIWLRYFLTAAEVDMKSVQIMTVPPPLMVENMSSGGLQGFCVGEPWGAVAADRNVGFMELASQDLWKNHPEKALVVNSQFAATRREDLKKVMMAVLEASRWIDKNRNRDQVATWLSQPQYINVPAASIESRLLGNYALGCSQGNHKYTDDDMAFYDNGRVNMPRKSHAMWFLAQYVRFGLLTTPPNYQAVADKLILSDLYAEVAAAMNIPLPNDEMQPIKTSYDIPFDPKNIPDYLSRTKRPVMRELTAVKSD